jgi:hypothetical protein
LIVLSKEEIEKKEYIEMTDFFLELYLALNFYAIIDDKI